MLIISGGIAAYKALELIRRLGERGAKTQVILTPAAKAFVTPLSVAALSGQAPYENLLDASAEGNIGHIQLSRQADLVLVLPATADFLAKMAHGLADDLASTCLLATDKPVWVVPAMNVKMWHHPATQANCTLLKARGIGFIGPEEGPMACGEYGLGRMAEIETVLTQITALLSPGSAKPLAGRRAIVTSGPTWEPIDSIRYIANRSSGKQGHAIAGALAASGAQVVLISGPVALAPPLGVVFRPVETAQEMQTAINEALPADIFVSAAAVADWRPARPVVGKIKKHPSNEVDKTVNTTREGEENLSSEQGDSFGAGQGRGRRAEGPLAEIIWQENPDLLAQIAHLPAPLRPSLVIGFAAEIGDIEAKARQKLQRKGCDWLLANDVGTGQIMGGEDNHLLWLHPSGLYEWPMASKAVQASRLCQAISAHFNQQPFPFALTNLSHP
jgi:phosphopantothenoylcysteine decarboxylase / phosphopantothenate---cysteine ligase